MSLIKETEETEFFGFGDRQTWILVIAVSLISYITMGKSLNFQAYVTLSLQWIWYCPQRPQWGSNEIIQLKGFINCLSLYKHVPLLLWRWLLPVWPKWLVNFLYMEHASAQILAALLGPREDMLSFHLHPSNLFCNLALFILGWHWTGTIQEVLPG